MDLEPVEQDLCRKVSHGEPFKLQSGQAVEAEVLRHILLGLPLIKMSAGVFRELARPTDSACDGLVCPRTPVGISIRGGKIRGRLKLDSASGENGGPLCPIHFEKVVFDGGFSGADGHFSHLSFRDCTFLDYREEALDSPQRGKILPSIDLSNARIESDLDLGGTHPEGLPPPPQPSDWLGLPAWREGDGSAGAHHHWIRLTGARIAGMVDLCSSYLRAPPAGKGAGSAQALDLSLIDAAGDFQFRGGSCAAGSIWGKNAHFRGDFWLSGARLDGRGQQSLMLQSATIDGMMVIDSRYDDQSCSEPYRRFSAFGEINLHALRLGGRLLIRDATVMPSKDARPSTTRSLAAEAKEAEETVSFLCLCLNGARMPALHITADPNAPASLIGLVQLEGLEVGGSVKLSHLLLGKDGRHSDDAIINARGLSAGVVELSHLKAAPKPGHKSRRALSLDVGNAIVRELKLTACEFNGPLAAASLTSQGDVILGVSLMQEADLSAATVGGSLDLSGLRIGAGATGGRLNLKGAQISRTLRIAGEPERSFRIELPYRPDPLRRPDVELSDASCRMLDDEGGGRWGPDLYIKMDRFVYSSATWEAPGAGEARTPLRRLGDWFNGKQAEWLIPECLAPPKLRARLRREPNYWAAWQIRRNWIYQQFPKARRWLAPSRHRLREGEYRPQPFEQAIRAARSEGREDIAIHFEILKRRIEWDLFNQTSRWWLGGIGILFACLWLLQQARWEPVVAVLVVTAFMTGVSWLWAWNKLPLGPCRMALLPLGLLWGLAFIAFFWGGWDSQPLVFLAAILIFGSVRLLSFLSNLAMRWMFGYLRRPVRAIGTFIAAFAVGWLGVYAANSHGMMIVDATPVAVAAAEEEGEESVRLRMASPNMAGEAGFIHNVRCGEAISAPLYALDVLIPLIDLRQESRCEPGRAHDAPQASFPEAAPRREGASLWSRAGAAWALAGRQLRAIVYQERFWAVMKALYAIAGWFIVSLSILTFANIHRAPAAGP